MSRWLDMDDMPAHQLLAWALLPPWEGGDGVGPHVARPVVWEQAAGNGTWRHEVARCQRPVPEGFAAGQDAIDCFLCLHRLSLEPALASRLNRDLTTLALEQEADGCNCKRDASNVGGFHSEDELFAFAAVRDSGLPAHLASAARVVEEFEAGLKGRAPTEMNSFPEAWLNVARYGHWNTFHSHPGCTFAGTYYVSDGGCCDLGADSHSGRLVLMPASPPTLSAHSLDYIHRCSSDDSLVQSSTARNADPEALAFLQIDPIPGTLILFPGFVPHFVLPMTHHPNASSGKHEIFSSEFVAAPRVSVAFNFVPT